VKIEVIKQLKPDLIIANKEENTKEAVAILRQTVPVYVSDVFDIKSNDKFISDVAQLTATTGKANKLIASIKTKFDALQSQVRLQRTVYMIWQNPWMTVGGDTFINRMMQYAGFDNLFADKLRYPATTIDELKDLKPEVVLLSSEPFPFKEKHKFSLQKQLPESKILLVKGEAFTWFGAYPETGLQYLLHLKQHT